MPGTVAAAHGLYLVCWPMKAHLNKLPSLLWLASWVQIRAWPDLKVQWLCTVGLRAYD